MYSLSFDCKGGAMFLYFISALLMGKAVQATQMDPWSALPSGLVVRQDPHGGRQIFKVKGKMDVKDDETAFAAIEKFVTAANIVPAVIPESELDPINSTEAWYYRGQGHLGYYGFSWFGKNFYYRPYYAFSLGYYNYFYYR